MLRWSALFLLIALVAAFFGFSGIATVATDAARVLFSIFLTCFILSVVFAIFLGTKLKFP